jgi:hypothetical protein
VGLGLRELAAGRAVDHRALAPEALIRRAGFELPPLCPMLDVMSLVSTSPLSIAAS